MSKWQEYGFPYPVGVLFQTALEGLLLAIRERRQIFCKNPNDDTELFLKYFYGQNNKLRYFVNVFYDIDFLIQRHLSGYQATTEGGWCYFILPDNNIFSLENAAAYLKEKLISLPQTISSTGILKTYAWICQRYRILNLAYQLRVPDQDIYGLEYVESGHGLSLSEAIEDFSRETRDIRGWSFLQMDITYTINYFQFEKHHYIRKHIYLPTKIIYPFYSPGKLSFWVTPDKTFRREGTNGWDQNSTEYIESQGDSCLRYLYSDFSLSLPFQKRVKLFELPLENTTGYKTEISLREAFSNKFFTAFEQSTIPAPPENYDYSTIYYGLIAGYLIGQDDNNLICDFREHLDFYDSIDKGE